MVVKVEKDRRVREQDGERQKRDPQQRVAHPPRVPESFGDAVIGAVFIRFDRDLENRLGERVQEPSAEYGERDSHLDVADPEEQRRPHEIHDDAQVGELNRKPHVRPAGQQLKLVTAPFGEIEECGIDVGHFVG